jgi:hypothetical protein
VRIRRRKRVPLTRTQQDDTKAIQKAIQDVAKTMCGDGCYSSTTHGAIIYFPSGTYLASLTIEKHYGTQLIGNVSSAPDLRKSPGARICRYCRQRVQPNSRPIIKSSRLFVGLGVFSTNKYYGDGKTDEAKQDHQWYINTVSATNTQYAFYRPPRGHDAHMAPNHRAYFMAKYAISS